MLPREDAPGLAVYTQTKAVGQRARDPFVEIIQQWGGSAAPRQAAAYGPGDLGAAPVGIWLEGHAFQITLLTCMIIASIGVFTSLRRGPGGGVAGFPGTPGTGST
jgi:hypothetical protein